MFFYGVIRIGSKVVEYICFSITSPMDGLWNHLNLNQIRFTHVYQLLDETHLMMD